MSILIAKEGEITWLASLQLDDLPNILPAGIQILNRSGEIGLRVDGLVGTIPLRNGQTLRITPKIGDANFLAMFFRAEGRMDEVERELDQFVEYSRSVEQSIESIVAHSLILSAAEIMRRSPMIRRVTQVRASRSAMGAIDPLATIQRLKSGSDMPVVSKTKARTVSTPENRIISMALPRAFGFLSNDDRSPFTNVIEHWNKLFPKSDNLLFDLEQVERGLALNRYGGPRGYYQNALVCSLIILGASGFSVSGADSVFGDSVLINTSDVYEKFLRNTMRKHFSDKGYLVTKTGISVTCLYTNGRYSLEPDIVVYKANKLVLICDAKYKAPSAADHYQMQTYLRRFGLRTGILLCPNFEGPKVEERVFEAPDGTIVREIYLPMGDLDITEEFLGTLVGNCPA
jgi:5-methylcytosine-specific restriction endonuclease McrBC regulatory subunit McrC